MVIVFLLVGLAALTVFAGLHHYLWRRLVRDTTTGPGPARRAGTALFVAGPVLMAGAVAAERGGAPFWLQRTLAWPGFLWMALALYLLLAAVAGEAVRPLVARLVRRRTAGGPAESRVPVGAAAGPAAASRPATEPVVPVVPGESGAGAPATASAGSGAPARPAADTATGTGTDTDTDTDTSTNPDGNAGRDGGLAVGPSRRLFVARAVGGAAAAVAVGTVGYGTYGVLRGPRVKRVTVPLARLPRSAHGFRIAVVSDIHLGPVLGRDFCRRVVDTVNSTQPDLIAVVGDLVDGSVKDLGPAAAPLAGLRARHGSYFVTGNHEYYSGAAQWVAEVRELGLRPLENARTELAGFDLAGVNDVAGESEGQGPDFGRALGGRDTSRAVVLLAHQPVQIHDAVRHGVDLQLSGHTHGGQLWPGNYVAELANPTVAGLERYGDTQLYVSRGAGAWGPPTRVGAPSDITVVELASRQA